MRRQLVHRVGDPGRVGCRQPRYAPHQQADGFARVEQINLHRGGETAPPRVPGGDEHLPRIAGQKRRQQLRVLGVVVDQQPAVPIPQGAE
ncbi:MAG: hypothetical protein ACRDRO_18990 [Pseudonocardiaceae bacterium]